MFIQTEPTPNPATLKFLPGRAVLASGTLDMRDKDAATQSPLAERLFDVAGVSGVFFGSDFIAVTKSEGEWQQLKPAILGVSPYNGSTGVPLDTALVVEREVFRSIERPADADLDRDPSSCLPLWHHSIPAEFKDHAWDFSRFDVGERLTTQSAGTRTYSE